MADAHVLGVARGDAAGPTLVLIGGMHGNEPAGVEAARRVMAKLAASPPLGGEVVALAAHVEALAAGTRCVVRDLNRAFLPDDIAAALASPERDAESRAVCALLAAFAEVRARARGQVFVVDLHTTSAAGVPFSIGGTTPQTVRLATELPLPCLVGMHTMLRGTLGEWSVAQGDVAFAVEGGQHDDPEAVDNLEAVAQCLLAALRLVPGMAVGAGARLRTAAGDLPSKIEVVSRHAVDPARGFRMVPGFANIQRVAAGTLLAHEGEREVRAPHDGFVLLPLYQPSGVDGFYFGREA